MVKGLAHEPVRRVGTPRALRNNPILGRLAGPLRQALRHIGPPLRNPSNDECCDEGTTFPLIGPCRYRYMV